MDEEMTLDDILNTIRSTINDTVTTDYTSYVDNERFLDRNIPIGDIYCGLGPVIYKYIRFWNEQDKEIPVEQRKPIKLYIDSIGGSLTDTFTIIDAIKASTTPVYTICNGVAYSGGFFIFICGQKRYSYPHSSFLFHEGATSTGGTSGQFENYAQFYKKQLNQLKEITLSNTKFTPEYYKEHQKEDLWFDVEEGVNLGFIDEVITTGMV